MCTCLGRAVRDMLKGIGVLTALGGLVPLLLGVRALLHLGAAVAVPDVAWLAYILLFFGGLLVVLGLGAATGSWCSLAAPAHTVS